jgi:hypothetical protein
MLFRIAFMVEQKDVGSAYARLAGLKIFNVEPPMPVQQVANGTMEDLISLEGRSQLNSLDVRKALVAGGRSAKSTGSVLYALTKKGLIKKTKTRGVYTVVSK